MADGKDILDDWIIYAHFGELLRRMLHRMNRTDQGRQEGKPSQPIPFPQPVPAPGPEPIPFPRPVPQRERPAAFSPNPRLVLPAVAGLLLKGNLSKVASMKQFKPASAVRIAESRTAQQLAKPVNIIRTGISGGRQGVARGSASLRGSGRGFLQNATASLARDLGTGLRTRKEIPGSSALQTGNKRKRLGGAWVSTFPPGYF